MSPRRAAAAESRAGRTAAAVITVAVLAIGLTLLARAKPTPSLLDPSSGAAQGARGLVLLLRDRGAEVEVTTDLDPGEPGRVLLLVDRLDEAQRTDLSRWVRRGGLAVIADPASPLVGSPALSGEEGVDGEDPAANPNEFFAPSIVRGTCDIAAVGHLQEISFEADRRPLPPAVPSGADDPILFPPSSGDSGCFGESAGAFIVARNSGDGLLVGLGENQILTNRLLTAGDNAAVATALLAPSADARVVILRGTGRPPVSSLGGERSLVDLVRPGVWMGLLTMLVAFVVFALSRSWRVGGPVAEPLPSSLASAELVVATGNLMQRAGHRDRAAQLLRYRFHRDLCAAFAVSPTASVGELDRAVSQRSTIAAGAIIAALADTPIGDDRRLTALADEMRRIGELATLGLATGRTLPPGPGIHPPNDPSHSHQEIR